MVSKKLNRMISSFLALSETSNVANITADENFIILALSVEKDNYIDKLSASCVTKTTDFPVLFNHW